MFGDNCAIIVCRDDLPYSGSKRVGNCCTLVRRSFGGTVADVELGARTAAVVPTTVAADCLRISRRLLVVPAAPVMIVESSSILVLVAEEP